ncbi:hypothetical protein SLS54_005167 [Diplodia seriata]
MRHNVVATNTNNSQSRMVLSMLLALQVCPAMMGTQEAIRQSQSKERREEHRARRCNLIATCVKPSIRSREINGRQVVLRDNKLYIDTGAAPEGDVDGQQPTSTEEDERAHGHPFAGYFLPYPDAEFEGLASTITDVAPILNWIYVDKDTSEVKYGVRADAQPHVTGPFDCTRQDRRMTFEGWEGFVAVEEYPAVWALYFDREDDGLKGKIPFGTRVLEVELQRTEKKITPDVMREARREQELFRLQMEQKRQQEAFHQQDVESAQQTPEGNADVESQQHESEKREDSGNASHNHIDETGLARLEINTDSAAHADPTEGTVTTPTDTNCGASVWSAPEETPRPARDERAIPHATPDSSVQGDDEVASVEAAFRQNDAVGAPPQTLSQEYRKPYVEDD